METIKLIMAFPFFIGMVIMLGIGIASLFYPSLSEYQLDDDTAV